MKKFLASLVLSACALSGLAQAGTVDDAVKRGTLRVGMDPTYMPFEMTNKQGQYIGFDVDLAKMVAKEMGVKVEFVNTAWDGIIPALLTDKFDVIMGGMTVTPQRNLRVNFADPYIVVGQTIVLRKDKAGEIKSFQTGMPRCLEQHHPLKRLPDQCRTKRRRNRNPTLFIDLIGVC